MNSFISKIKTTVKLIKDYGIRYTITLNLWFSFGCLESKIPKNKIREKLLSKMDKLEDFCNTYDHHLDGPTDLDEYLDERTMTPCGCMWFGCDECGSNTVCSQADNYQEMGD